MSLNKVKNFVSKVKSRLLKSSPAVDPRFVPIFEPFELERTTSDPETILRYAACGSNIRFRGKAIIMRPRHLVLGSNIQFGNDLQIESRGGVIIGNNVIIGDRVSIESLHKDDANSHYRRLKLDEVVLYDNVVIGNDVTIFPGVTIGSGARVPDGSTIKSNIPGDTSNYRPSGIPSGQMFFILSTGRAGSTSMAAILSQHPSIQCEHELTKTLIKLSTDYAHGNQSREEVMPLLRAIYTGKDYRQDSALMFGDSNHKLAHLAPLLYELHPEARFIHLIRDGRAFVNSALVRDWYTEGNSVSGDFHETSKMWNSFRIRGDLMGEYSEAEWAAMSPFEKTCWYWTHVNERIESDLKHIPADQQLKIHLEDLNDQLPQLQEFLGVKMVDLDIVTTNRSAKPKRKASEWTTEEEAAFQRICGPLMKRESYS